MLPRAISAFFQLEFRHGHRVLLQKPSAPLLSVGRSIAGVRKLRESPPPRHRTPDAPGGIQARRRENRLLRRRGSRWVTRQQAARLRSRTRAHRFHQRRHAQAKGRRIELSTKNCPRSSSKTSCTRSPLRVSSTSLTGSKNRDRRISVKKLGFAVDADDLVAVFKAHWLQAFVHLQSVGDAFCGQNRFAPPAAPCCKW